MFLLTVANVITISFLLKVANVNNTHVAFGQDNRCDPVSFACNSKMIKM